MKKLKVEEAAKLMGVHPQWIRRGLISGRLKFGYAVKGKGKWSYWISPELFQEQTGIRCSE